MSDLILRRVSVVNAGAFGVLIDGKTSEPFALSLERTYDSPAGPWTKIPPGAFVCKPRRYNRGGYQTFEILVPGHSAILFHRGNVEMHSEGCVLVGEMFSQVLGTFGITYSAEGFAEFYRRYSSRKEFSLLVDGVPGAPKPAKA